MAGSTKSQPHDTWKSPDPQKVFGDIIRERRMARNLSQREFTALTDLERSTIAYIELGKRQPSLATIMELARALEVLPSELMQEMERRLRLGNHAV
jgi:transcriptional regulator with XRE-family HTH domain